MHFGITFLLTLLLQQGIIPGNWDFQFEKENVMVYTQPISGSNFNAFKGEMLMDGTPEEIASVIMDINNLKDWSYKTTSTRVLKETEDTVFYYYISDTPKIVKNREGYFFTSYSKDSLNNKIVIKIGTYKSDVEVPHGYVRIPFSEGSWELIPKTNSTTKAIFKMQAEPGGVIPSWLANMASSDTPWITMSKLQKSVRERRNK